MISNEEIVPMDTSEAHVEKLNSEVELGDAICLTENFNGSTFGKVWIGIAKVS